MAQPIEAGAAGTARRTHRNPVLRGIYFVLGLLCLALIPISYLPGIPTFDLILLAAFFFSMSSERMHNWMLNHPYFGKVIRGYREHGLTMRMKWAAVVAITLSLTASAVFLVDDTVVKVILGSVGVFAVWFVFTRPTRDMSAV